MKTFPSPFRRLGALVLAAALFLPGLSKASQILFVVGSTALIPGDQAVKNLLESSGHLVTVRSGMAVSPAVDTMGKAAVLISSSAPAIDVNTKFRSSLKPVLVWENAILKDMAMTGPVSGVDFGTSPGHTQVVMTGTSHALAAGLTGTVTISTMSNSVTWGRPTTGATLIASQSGDATHWVIFGYETGAPMSGLVAPARRVGFFADDATPSFFTSQGQALFNAAVNWILGGTAPTITAQPANATVTQGQTAFFSVTATGTAPLTYQWRRNGSTISGATGSTYTTPPASGSDNGAVFSVMVANSAGSVTSGNASLTVNQPPVITQQPNPITVIESQPAAFSANATGTAPLNYQWLRNGSPIAGANSPSFTLPAAALSDNGAGFSVQVSNPFGNVNSMVANLTVNPTVAPSITAQPANRSVIAPAAATFSVTATGSPSPAYQWRKNGTAISGATSSSYTTPATTGSDQGAVYSVVVSNVAGSVTSSGATLSVTVPVAPAITTQPAAQTVNVGSTATFTAAASGTAPLSYQWRKDGSNISGATSASYTTPATDFEDNGAVFSVVVTNVAGSATSNNAPLTVLSAPILNTQPASQTVIIPATATFSVSATGTSPLTYQWRKNGTTISGANAAIYTTTATTSADNGAVYSVVVTNSVGSTTSSNATLTANTAPSITTQPASQSVTAPAMATFSVVAAGTSPLAYQWRRNGVSIPGAISASYTTPSTIYPTDNAALYSVVITNAAGAVTSGNATLTVNPTGFPTFTAQPMSIAVNPGQMANFMVSVTGSSPFNFQWRRNGANIPGATLSSYTTPPVNSADNGAQFSVAVTNSMGTAFSNAASLSVNAPPTITSHPQSQAVLQGSSATFSVGASGTSPFSYKWMKNGSPISGATGSTYMTPPGNPSDHGAQFSVTVTNVAGNATSSTATLTVNMPPSIVAQPVSQAVTETMPATFNVGATGTSPLNYQWRRNGTDIPGATGPAYTLAAPALSDNGAIFSVLVSNPFGTMLSGNATLAVNAATAPAITTQPVNAAVTAGAAATFSVTASGSPPPTYQWRKNGANISGATSSTYTNPATVAGDNGVLYSVVVTNMAGSVSSNNATLTVNIPPTIATQPVGQTATAGATATFTVAALGTSPFTYQWLKNGTNISGATSASYTTPATVSGDNGSLFSVVVTNVAGSATSSDAALYVQFAPAFTTQPANAAVTLGLAATFTAAASGNPAATYQWRKNGTNISGATSASYTTPATVSGDNGAVFSVVATNSVGSATSSNATLTVNSPPTITTQPKAQSVIVGGMATFSVSVSGTSPFTYQWQKNSIAISGATAASYTTPPTMSTDNGAIFSVMVTNVAGSVFSTNATLTVNPVGFPVINAQPMDRTVDPGQTATFTVMAMGNALLTYQWRKNGANIPGATLSSHTTTPATSADNNTAFSVVVSNSLGAVTSNNAVLTVNVPPTITTQPVNQVVLQGVIATFSVAATGSNPLTYQWRKNGIAISGATAPTYTTPPTTGADHNAVFTVVVTNTAGSATSVNATLTVNSPPSIVSQPANQSVNAGTTATFFVVVTGTAPFTYQWRKNGTPISGVTTASYTTPATVPGDNGGLFSVVVTNAFGNVTSSNATLTVITQVPVITTQPASQGVVLGRPATFTVLAGGIPAPAYQWRRNGTNIAGATGTSFTLPVTMATDDGDVFTVVVSNSVGSITSAGAVLTLQPRPTTQTVSLSGELYDAAGNPIGAGAPVSLSFQVLLYDSATGGTPVYGESFDEADGLAVPVSDGLFTLRLGTGNTQDNLQKAASEHASLWAEIQVAMPGGSLETIQPRLPVTAPLHAGTPRVTQGAAAPTVALAEPVGAYYRNSTDNSLWIRMEDTWMRISP